MSFIPTNPYTVKTTQLSEEVRVSTVRIEILDPGPYETMAFAPWFGENAPCVRNNTENAALACHETMVSMLKNEYVTAAQLRARAQAAVEIFKALEMDDFGLAVDRASITRGIVRQLPDPTYDPRIDAIATGPRKIRLEK
jgi:hypothetical protein